MRWTAYCTVILGLLVDGGSIQAADELPASRLHATARHGQVFLT